MNGGKSMRKKRHNYSPEEKVLILKRHLVGREAVSDLCDEYQLQPKIFYGWQKQFFEKGASAFAREGKDDKQQAEEKRIRELEEKLRRKHEVLSELLEEHIQLKKELGEL
jgi:transposase-like protein